MFEEKLGVLPKKKVVFDGKNLTIGKETIVADEIKRIYFQPYSFIDNSWGAVYFSLTGADNVEVVNNREVKFTKGQTDKVLSLLDMLDKEVVEREIEKPTPQSVQKNIRVCPNCSSANIDFVGNQKKGFSVGKAVGGAVLNGGIGTLAGFTVKKEKKDLWHCKNCGNKFELKS